MWFTTKAERTVKAGISRSFHSNQQYNNDEDFTSGLRYRFVLQLIRFWRKTVRREENDYQ